jgi:cytochrome P450
MTVDIETTASFFSALSWTSIALIWLGISSIATVAVSCSCSGAPNLSSVWQYAFSFVFRYFLVTRWRKTPLSKLPSSESPWLVVGQFVDGGVDALMRGASIDNSVTRTPPLMRCGMFLDGTESVITAHPDAVREVLTRDHVFIKHPAIYDTIEIITGQGLVRSSGELWARQRKLLTPLFHLQQLRAYVPIMNDEAKLLLRVFDATGGASIHPTQLIGNGAQSVLMRAVFADRLDIEQMTHVWEKATDGVSAFMAGLLFLPRRVLELVPLGPTAEFVRHVRHTRRLVGEAVDAVRASGDVVASDLLGQMAMLRDESGTFLIDRELIVDEAVVMLVAGRDTTSVTLSWTLYFLATRPALQDELFTEFQAVIGAAGADIDDAQCRALKLHNATMREVLRMRPPVLTFDRLVVEDGVSLLGQPIPKGTAVIASAVGVGLNEDVYERPLEFDPHRWLDEAMLEKRHPFSWVPFSAAARSCIGQKMAVLEYVIMLAHIMSRFRITGDVSNVVAAYRMTLEPKHLMVSFVPRTT